MEGPHHGVPGSDPGLMPPEAPPPPSLPPDKAMQYHGNHVNNMVDVHGMRGNPQAMHANMMGNPHGNMQVNQAHHYHGNQQYVAQQPPSQQFVGPPHGAQAAMTPQQMKAMMMQNYQQHQQQQQQQQQQNQYHYKPVAPGGQHYPNHAMYKGQPMQGHHPGGPAYNAQMGHMRQMAPGAQMGPGGQMGMVGPQMGNVGPPLGPQMNQVNPQMGGVGPQGMQRGPYMSPAMMQRMQQMQQGMAPPGMQPGMQSGMQRHPGQMGAMRHANIGVPMGPHQMPPHAGPHHQVASHSPMPQHSPLHQTSPLPQRSPLHSPHPTQYATPPANMHPQQHYPSQQYMGSPPNPIMSPNAGILSPSQIMSPNSGMMSPNQALMAPPHTSPSFNATHPYPQKSMAYGGPQHSVINSGSSNQLPDIRTFSSPMGAHAGRSLGPDHPVARAAMMRPHPPQHGNAMAMSGAAVNAQSQAHLMTAAKFGPSALRNNSPMLGPQSAYNAGASHGCTTSYVTTQANLGGMSRQAFQAQTVTVASHTYNNAMHHNAHHLQPHMPPHEHLHDPTMPDGTPIPNNSSCANTQSVWSSNGPIPMATPSKHGNRSPVAASHPQLMRSLSNHDPESHLFGARSALGPALGVGAAEASQAGPQHPGSSSISSLPASIPPHQHGSQAAHGNHEFPQSETDFKQRTAELIQRIKNETELEQAQQWNKTNGKGKQESGADDNSPKITVPFGWNRIVDAGQIVYVSPSGIQLDSMDNLRNYLTTEGTCKCGLECPLRLEKVFSFDPAVSVRPWSGENHAVNDDLTKLCNHKRKIAAMATFQKSGLQKPLPGKGGSTKIGCQGAHPYDGMAVSQLMSQRKEGHNKAGFDASPAGPNVGTAWQKYMEFFGQKSDGQNNPMCMVPSDESDRECSDAAGGLEQSGLPGKDLVPADISQQCFLQEAASHNNQYHPPHKHGFPPPGAPQQHNHLKRFSSPPDNMLKGMVGNMTNEMAEKIAAGMMGEINSGGMLTNNFVENTAFSGAHSMQLNAMQCSSMATQRMWPETKPKAKKTKARKSRSKKQAAIAEAMRSQDCLPSLTTSMPQSMDDSGVSLPPSDDLEATPEKSRPNSVMSADSSKSTPPSVKLSPHSSPICPPSACSMSPGLNGSVSPAHAGAMHTPRHPAAPFASPPHPADPALIPAPSEPLLSPNSCAKRPPSDCSKQYPNNTNRNMQNLFHMNGPGFPASSLLSAAARAKVPGQPAPMLGSSPPEKPFPPGFCESMPGHRMGAGGLTPQMAMQQHGAMHPGIHPANQPHLQQQQHVTQERPYRPGYHDDPHLMPANMLANPSCMQRPQVMGFEGHNGLPGGQMNMQRLQQAARMGVPSAQMILQQMSGGRMPVQQDGLLPGNHTIRLPVHKEPSPIQMVQNMITGLEATQNAIAAALESSMLEDDDEDALPVKRRKSTSSDSSVSEPSAVPSGTTSMSSSGIGSSVSSCDSGCGDSAAGCGTNSGQNSDKEMGCDGDGSDQVAEPDRPAECPMDKHDPPATVPALHSQGSPSEQPDLSPANLDDTRTANKSENIESEELAGDISTSQAGEELSTSAADEPRALSSPVSTATPISSPVSIPTSTPFTAPLSIPISTPSQPILSPPLMPFVNTFGMLPTPVILPALPGVISMVTQPSDVVPIVTQAGGMIPIETQANEMLPVITQASDVLPLVAPASGVLSIVTPASEAPAMVTPAARVSPVETQTTSSIQQQDTVTEEISSSARGADHPVVTTEMEDQAAEQTKCDEPLMNEAEATEMETMDTIDGVVEEELNKTAVSGDMDNSYIEENPCDIENSETIENTDSIDPSEDIKAESVNTSRTESLNSSAQSGFSELGATEATAEECGLGEGETDDECHMDTSSVLDTQLDNSQTVDTSQCVETSIESNEALERAQALDSRVGSSTGVDPDAPLDMSTSLDTSGESVDKSDLATGESPSAAPKQSPRGGRSRKRERSKKSSTPTIATMLQAQTTAATNQLMMMPGMMQAPHVLPFLSNMQEGNPLGMPLGMPMLGGENVEMLGGEATGMNLPLLQMATMGMMSPVFQNPAFQQLLQQQADAGLLSPEALTSQTPDGMTVINQEVLAQQSQMLQMFMVMQQQWLAQQQEQLTAAGMLPEGMGLADLGLMGGMGMPLMNPGLLQQPLSPAQLASMQQNMLQLQQNLAQVNPQLAQTMVNPVMPMHPAGLLAMQTTLAAEGADTASSTHDTQLQVNVSTTSHSNRPPSSRATQAVSPKGGEGTESKPKSSPKGRRSRSPRDSTRKHKSPVSQQRTFVSDADSVPNPDNLTQAVSAVVRGQIVFGEYLDQENPVTENSNQESIENVDTTSISPCRTKESKLNVEDKASNLDIGESVTDNLGKSNVYSDNPNVNNECGDISDKPMCTASTKSAVEDGSEETSGTLKHSQPVDSSQPDICPSKPSMDSECNNVLANGECEYVDGERCKEEDHGANDVGSLNTDTSTNHMDNESQSAIATNSPVTDRESLATNHISSTKALSAKSRPDVSDGESDIGPMDASKEEEAEDMDGGDVGQGYQHNPISTRFRRQLVSNDYGQDGSPEESSEDELPMMDDIPEPSSPRNFKIGDLVWGQIRGFPSWPGKLVCESDVKGSPKSEKGKVWVRWFGPPSFTQVDPGELKTLSEGLEAHHGERQKCRKGRRINSNLEAAIQEAMAELDKQAEAGEEEMDATPILTESPPNTTPSKLRLNKKHNKRR